jgi:hypothetical protein
VASLRISLAGTPQIADMVINVRQALREVIPAAPSSFSFDMRGAIRESGHLRFLQRRDRTRLAKLSRARPVILVAPDVRLVDEGNWVACVDCAELIEVKKWKALMDRAKKLEKLELGLRSGPQFLLAG